MKKTQSVILDPHTVVALLDTLFRNDEKVLEMRASGFEPLVNLKMLIRPLIRHFCSLS